MAGLHYSLALRLVLLHHRSSAAVALNSLQCRGGRGSRCVVPELKAGKAAICVRNTSARREATGAASSTTAPQHGRPGILPSDLYAALT